MTYTEQSTQLVLNASVAVQVLLGDAPGDCEFIPLRPKQADAAMLADISARWPGRGLRSVGVIGLCGVSPRVALKEPLDTKEVKTLAVAFLAYLSVMFAVNFAAQVDEAEIQELHRLWALPDTRPN